MSTDKTDKPKETFKELLKNFCLDGTILGLKYFYLFPDKVSRIFWAVSMVLSTAFAFVLMLGLLRRFNSMPTRITIESQFEPATQLPFPAIVVCTPNQMAASNVAHFKKTLVDGELYMDIEEIIPNLLGFYEHIPNLNTTTLTHLQTLIDRNRHTIGEVMQSLPQNCESFLRKCTFRRQVQNCSDLFHPILTNHGLCCAFNSPYRYQDSRNIKHPNFKPQMGTIGGLAEALSVVTDYHLFDAVNGSLTGTGAVRVMINDWTEFPSDDLTILVSPSVESIHHIEGSLTYCSADVSLLSVDVRKCLFQEEGNNRNTFSIPALNLTGQYHNSDCDTLCYINLLYSRCQCSPHYLPTYRRAEVCKVTNIPCIVETKDYLGKAEEPDDCECPRDCNFRKYKMETSILNLEALEFNVYNDYYSMKFNQCSNIMHFSLKPLFMKQKQETVMPLVSLTSNLGGVFGLCLGISALSVLEILFFIYRVLKNRYFSKKEI